jgi:hypothetical protein
MSRCLRRLGLTWQKVKPKKRTLGSCRKDAIRNFLIGCDKHHGDPTVVFVCTDESHIHAGHGVGNSCCTSESETTGSDSKGRRLVVLHAIAENDPLAELDEEGVPVDDLNWNGDTPHPGNRPDGKLTCEALWMASSSKGDCHDNMNGEMFLQWNENKLIATFQAACPEKKMVLVADNAACHHVRVMGGLSGLSKKKIVDQMKKTFSCQNSSTTPMMVPNQSKTEWITCASNQIAMSTSTLTQWERQPPTDDPAFPLSTNSKLHQSHVSPRGNWNCWIVKWSTRFDSMATRCCGRHPTVWMRSQLNCSGHLGRILLQTWCLTSGK